MNADMKHCISMIEREERCAGAAPTPEAAEMHYQMIMLYRAQLNCLRKRDTTINTERAKNRSVFN